MMTEAQGDLMEKEELQNDSKDRQQNIEKEGEGESSPNLVPMLPYPSPLPHHPLPVPKILIST